MALLTDENLNIISYFLNIFNLLIGYIRSKSTNSI